MAFEKEYSTYQGCTELVNKIKQFWAKRGHYPAVWAEKVLANHTPGFETYTVNSDMVGGQPRGQAR